MHVRFPRYMALNYLSRRLWTFYSIAFRLGRTDSDNFVEMKKEKNLFLIADL